MPASIPIRHGGTFASRDTILARATFSRSTIPPRASRPIRCSVFLPGSIPMVTTAVLDFGMAWCSFCCPTQACSLAGREHGRSIPFSDIKQLVQQLVESTPSAPMIQTGKMPALDQGAEMVHVLKTGSKATKARARKTGAPKGRKSAKTKRRISSSVTHHQAPSVADLQAQLEHRTTELDRALERQTATADPLRVIASSP